MPFKEFETNWQTFKEIINTLPESTDEQIQSLLRRYTEQNILLLNDIVNISIENLTRLKDAQNANDIICMQARFTNDISKKIALSAQRFLNASLGHIADYNEWLKAHCDLSTD